LCDIVKYVVYCVQICTLLSATYRKFNGKIRNIRLVSENNMVVSGGRNEIVDGEMIITKNIK